MGAALSELRLIQEVLDKQPSQGDVHKIWEHVKKRIKILEEESKNARRE